MSAAHRLFCKKGLESPFWQGVPGKIMLRTEINPDTKCWDWKGPINNNGYGVTYILGQVVYSHRLMYREFVGPIPAGMELDHLCKNPACCNPAHLEAVTHHENVKRSDTFAMGSPNRDKPFCSRGHPYSGENLRVIGKKRYCKECVRESVRRSRKNRKLLAQKQ